MSSRRLQGVFKMSWKTKNCYAEDVLKKSPRRLEDRQMFAGLADIAGKANTYTDFGIESNDKFSKF